MTSAVLAQTILQLGIEEIFAQDGETDASHKGRAHVEARMIRHCGRE